MSDKWATWLWYFNISFVNLFPFNCVTQPRSWKPYSFLKFKFLLVLFSNNEKQHREVSLCKVDNVEHCKSYKVTSSMPLVWLPLTLHEGGLRIQHPLVSPVLTAWHLGARVKVRRSRENVMPVMTSFSMTNMVVGQWRPVEAHPQRDAQISAGNSTNCY